MDGDEHVALVRSGDLDVLDDMAAILFDSGRFAEDGARAGRAERDDEVGFDRSQLSLEPLIAGRDFHLVRLLVNAPLAARFELEMLHCIRDVSELTVDSGFLERAIEHTTRRSDERLAREVFLIARLFADEKDLGALRAGTEHRLCRVPPQGAVAAALYRDTQRIEIRAADLGTTTLEARRGALLPACIAGRLVKHLSNAFEAASPIQKNDGARGKVPRVPDSKGCK